MEYTILECKELDEKVYIYTHPSGLKLYICPKPGYAKKCAYFAANYGSMDIFYQKDGKTFEIPDGTAHFLEHKLFESEEGDAFSKYAKTGASANAFTSFGCTAYYFTCTSRFSENLAILTDLMQTPYFTPQNVQKEQGIIGQEINMYLDAPDWRVYQNMLEAMYQKCTVRRDIAGSVESIASITDRLLYACYDMYYAPENMVLVITGDLSPEDTAKESEQLLSKMRARPAPQKVYPDEPAGVLRNYIEQKLSVSFPVFMIGFKSRPGKDGYDTIRREIIGKTAMGVLFGRSSRFFLDAYDAGLINDNFDSDFEICANYAHALLSGEGEQYRTVWEKVLETIRDACQNGVAQQDFERRLNLLRSGYIKSFNSVETITRNFMDAAFGGYALYDYLAAFDQVTLEDIQLFIKEEMAEQNGVLSVILPK